MRIGPIISAKELAEMKTLFWVVYADETKNDPVVNSAAYDVLKALESYRKALNGKEI